jgi:hypothetical protein
MKEKEKRNSPYHIRFPLSSNDRRSLHLSPDESIDIEFLKKEVERVKQELDEIQFNTEKRFVPLSVKESLQIQLMDKEKEKEKLEGENKYLCQLYLYLNQCVKAAKAYYSSSKLSQAPTVSLTEYIAQSLERLTHEDIHRTLDDFIDENQEEEKEAEFILNCCQRFNELFNNECYSEAALIAATSPQGVLRTLEILHKFKTVSLANESLTPSPLMAYCTALMDTSDAYHPVSVEESQECLECALKHGDMNSIAKWIHQESLSLCKEMGVVLYENCHCDMKCKCQCCLLALVVFKKLNCHYEECLCLCKLGKLNALLSKITSQAYTKNEIASLLADTCSLQLAISLLAPPIDHAPFLHLLEVLYIFIKTESYHLCQDIVRSYSVLKQKSYQEIFSLEVELRPDIATSLIPILSQQPQLHWVVDLLTIPHIVQTAITRAVDRIVMSTTSTATSYTSEPSSSKSSRPKLIRSQKFDEDDGDSLASHSSRQSVGSDNSSIVSTSDDDGND